MASPITILVGEESYLVSRALVRLEKEVIDPAVKDFNYNQFSARSDSVAKILDCCALFPMMAEKRLVIVRDAEAIKKEDAETWLSYFNKPIPSTHLVLVASKIDARLKIWKTATDLRLVTSLKTPYENELPQWVMGEAKERGVSITSEAAHALSQSIGNSLMALVSALEKLKLYIVPETSIELKHVEEIVGPFFSKTIFDFADKVGNRKLREATAILNQMATKGEPFVLLLFMINRHFRLLLLAHEEMNAGTAPPTIAKVLGVSPFFIKDYLNQAKKIPLKTLKKIYTHLLTTDRALKRSPLSNQHVMENFLMQVCL